MLDLLRRIAAGERYDPSKLADYVERVKVDPEGLGFRDGHATQLDGCWYFVEEGFMSEPMTLEQVQVKLLTERSPF